MKNQQLISYIFTALALSLSGCSKEPMVDAKVTVNGVKNKSLLYICLGDFLSHGFWYKRE